MRARSTSSIRLRGLRSADRARTAAPQPRSLAIDVTSPWLRRPTEQLRRGGPGRGSPPGSGAWDRLERRRRQPPCHGAGIGTCRDAGRTRLSETVDLLGSNCSSAASTRRSSLRPASRIVTHLIAAKVRVLASLRATTWMSSPCPADSARRDRSWRPLAAIRTWDAKHVFHGRARTVVGHRTVHGVQIPSSECRCDEILDRLTARGQIAFVTIRSTRAFAEHRCRGARLLQRKR